MTARRPQRGTTLIELMVALLIGTLLTIAVFLVMSTFEGRRRTLGSGADLDQNGSVAMFQLDQWIRSAGTGIAQTTVTYSNGSSLPYAYGCQLFAQKSGTQLLPVTGAVPLPAPFSGAVQTTTSGVFRLAPVLIIPGGTAPSFSTANTPTATSDVLQVMGAGSGNGQMPSLFNTPPTSTQLNLVNTMAFAASSPTAPTSGPSDLILLADRQGASPGAIVNIPPCLVSQVASSFTGPVSSTNVAVTALPLGGAWYAATVGTTSVTGYSSSGVAVDLGNPAAVTPPSFQLFGVGDSDTLYSYDLLNVASTPLQMRAEGVFEMHALYGVGSTFFSPSTGTYAYSALTTGDSTAAALIRTITSIRVGLIMRTALPEKDPVKGPTTLTLFSDLPTALQYSRPLTSAEQHYRYRVIEATIPMRNTF